MSMTGDIDGYDLIGDVHGCGATLAALLEKLGYHQKMVCIVIQDAR